MTKGQSHRRALAEAAKVRAKRIEMLTLCACTWPVREYDSQTGHAESCPAHMATLAELAAYVRRRK